MTCATLSVLVSTYNARLLMLDSVLLEENPLIHYIIVHQHTDGVDYSNYVSKLNSTRSDVTYIQSFSKGVTKSRNIALSKVESEYGLFMDDDVELPMDLFSTIIESFKVRPECSVLTFQAAEIGNVQLLKDYSEKQAIHNRLSILKVGTIEVAFRVSDVRASDVKFPEYLGAGTNLPACDEPVFLARLMSKGLKIGYMPLIIAHHPKLSSGKVFEDESSLVCRGVAFRDIFGNMAAIPMLFLFYLKNRKKFKLRNRSAFLSLYKGYLKTNFN
ncbi:glycosyltransferase family 2 protein [Shewanella sp. Scap07]|uniref:glycosyltransferase n=1 Tax=Shewanella sp. Scap07 TaxID=2589987 RepID=UPI002119A484|nr:glycosyltransferase [Shewanella sp. Scap07]QLE86118.1 glycosyltransferase family 2 protein [Shewanella sp. Scap07]